MATFLLLVATILTSQLVSWFLFRAARGNRDFPDAGPRTLVMHYCGSIRLAAVLLPGVVMGLLLMLVNDPVALGSAARQVLVWLLPLAALGAGALAIEAWTRRILLDDDGIRSRSLFGETRLGWEEIDEVSWDRWLKMVVVRGRDGRRIRVNPSLSGLGMFELLLLERVERRRLTRAMPGFDALRRGAY